MVKMTTLSNTTYRFNAILIKIPITFFTHIEKNNPKIQKELQITQKNSRSNPEGKEFYKGWRHHII
jgi:hypothetical protein